MGFLDFRSLGIKDRELYSRENGRGAREGGEGNPVIIFIFFSCLFIYFIYFSYRFTGVLKPKKLNRPNF